MSRGRFPEDIQFIPGGGELVLGQAARLREDGLFDLQKAFQGQLAHVNIWHVAFDQSSVQKVISSNKNYNYLLHSYSNISFWRS